MSMKIIGPKEGKSLNVLGDRQLIKLTGEDTAGAFAMVEQQNLPGTSIPSHMHTREQETFYIAEGQVEFTSGQETIVAGPGTTVFLPAKTPHSFKVIGDQPARVIVLISPPGCEKMFEELAALPPGPPDMGKIANIIGHYGVTFL
jgi:quercetin dioxygenase-like cupin family protein